MNSNIKVTSQELRELLLYINDSRLDTCVRFRLIGEMWHANYMRVIQLTEKGVTLHDERDNKFFTVRDLNNVMQFELDQPLHQYQPYFHYHVQPGEKVDAG